MNEPIHQRFESIAARVNADHPLVHRGRYLSADIKVIVGDVPYLLRIREGAVELSRQMPLFASAELVIQADEATWTALWAQPHPQPGWHDLFALTKRGAMRIEGNSQLFFAHLQYLKDVLGAPGRGRLAEATS